MRSRLPGLAHAPLEHVAHAEPLADHAEILVLSLEREARRARRDAQARHRREHVDDLLRDPVGEVLVVRVGAQVREREHRHRLPPSCGATPAQPARRRTTSAAPRRPARRVASARRGPSPAAAPPSRSVPAGRRTRARRPSAACGGSAWRSSPGCVAPVNGCSPVSISYSMHPSANRSLRPSIVSPAACSGLMYAGVPTVTPDLRETSRALRRRREHRLADPEVGDERVPVVQHDVLGLDVAVHHAVAVRVVQRVGHLARDAHRVVDGQLARCVEPVAQRLRPRRSA